MAPGTVGNIVPSYNSEKDRYEETYITDDFVAVEVPGTADHLWYVTIDRAQLPAGCTNGSRLTVGEFSTIVANDESLASLLSAEHRTMAQSTEETGPVDMVKFIAAWASWADFSRNNTPPAFHLINNTGKNKGKGPSRNQSRKMEKTTEAVASSSYVDVVMGGTTKAVASSSGSKKVAKIYPTLDPHKPLEDVNCAELEKLDMRSDDSDDGEIRAPFYVQLCFMDTSDAKDRVPDGLDESETWFGPYHCVQEANDATVILAHDNYRNHHMRYYGSADSAPTVKTLSDNGDGQCLIGIEQSDPGLRFWLIAQGTCETPDDEVNEAVVTRQGWDIFLVTCIVSGAMRNGHVSKTHPRISNKISVSRNNANKYAAALFLKVTKFLLPDDARNEYIDDIVQVTIDAEAKMTRAANHAYNWSYSKEFTGIKRDKKAKEAPTTYVKISVDKFDTDP